MVKTKTKCTRMKCTYTDLTGTSAGMSWRFTYGWTTPFLWSSPMVKTKSKCKRRALTMT